MQLPPRVSLAQLPTPLAPLRRLQAERGGPLIWLKRDDLTGCTLTGNKVRKLEFIFGKALHEGYRAVVTCGGIQSNHCRATALAAAQLGLDCHLILRGEPQPGDTPQGNQFLDALAGASISYHPLKEYVGRLDELFESRIEDYAELGVKALAVPTGGSDGVGIWGYLTAFQELQQDFAQRKLKPAAIISATGSGGTQAGLTVGAALAGNPCPVIGINVCDDEAYFQAKIRQDISQWQQLYPDASSSSELDCQVNVIDGYVGAGYAKAGPEVIRTIRELAQLEGVVFDPVYTGKAFNGLLAEIAAGRFAGADDIVFIHTGGIFGLFPYAASF